jgi:hypothetical protein
MLSNQEIIHLQRTILSGVVANETLGLHWKFDLNQRYFRHPLHKKIVELQNNPVIEVQIESYANQNKFENELIQIIGICPIINWKHYYEQLKQEYIYAKAKNG